MTPTDPTPTPLERHHLRMDALQVTLERVEVTLAAIKDMLNRPPNGH
jgi:hypothetical protein